MEFDSESYDRMEKALVTMDYTVTVTQTDKGDQWHPPEWEITTKINDLNIDGEDIAEPLRGLLIEFLKRRIK